MQTINDGIYRSLIWTPDQWMQLYARKRTSYIRNRMDANPKWQDEKAKLTCLTTADCRELFTGYITYNHYINISLLWSEEIGLS